MKLWRTLATTVSALGTAALVLVITAGCASEPRVASWGSLPAGTGVSIAPAVWRGTGVPPVSGLLDILVRQAAAAGGWTIHQDEAAMSIEAEFSSSTRLVGSAQRSTAVCVLRARPPAADGSTPAPPSVEVVAIMAVDADGPDAAELYDLVVRAFRELAR